MNRRGTSRSKIVSVLCDSGVEELKPFMMLDIPLGVSVCSSMKSLGCIGFTGSDRGMIVGVSRVKMLWAFSGKYRGSIWKMLSDSTPYDLGQ